ncbi:MAG: PLP-dependent aspartate aminotransferase family protein [Candidatus Korobacteraceae bacterium]
MASRTHDIATVAIHGGRTLDSHASSLIFPLYQTGTFVHDAVGVDKGFSYSRVSNPTVDALEKAIGSLEGTAPAVCFRSGMAAESALFFSVLKAGEHAILSEVAYGGTIRLFREILEPLGVHATFVDTSNPANVEAAITPQTRIVFIESPANPILTLTDIAAIADITERHGLLLAMDNTFLTPALQRPLELGADISVLSTTKYIDGHNATVGGSLATNNEALAERFRLIRKTLGSIQAPFEAWLTLQGLKTLPARLRLHCENAQVIAEWLEAHSAVSRIYYPGLRSFPQYELALRQQRAPGAMISFELDAPYATTIAVLNAVQLCSRAESLGGLETLITHPASTTHADLGPEFRERLGISEGLIRLSVGLESPADIIADLEQAFAAAGCSNLAKESANEVR